MDYSFAVLNREHFTRNESFAEKAIGFTADNNSHGRATFVAAADLAARNFLFDDARFLIELELRNPVTELLEEIQLPRDQRELNHLDRCCSVCQVRDLSVWQLAAKSLQTRVLVLHVWLLWLESVDFSTPRGRRRDCARQSAQWPVDGAAAAPQSIRALVPSALPSGLFVGQSAAGHGQCRASIGRQRCVFHASKMQCPSAGVPDCLAGDCKGKTIDGSLFGQLTSRRPLRMELSLQEMCPIALVDLLPTSRNKNCVRCYDMDKQVQGHKRWQSPRSAAAHNSLDSCSTQEWIVESDILGRMVKLRLYYVDIRNVPRHFSRLVCWNAYLIPYDRSKVKLWCDCSARVTNALCSFSSCIFSSKLTISMTIRQVKIDELTKPRSLFALICFRQLYERQTALSVATTLKKRATTALTWHLNCRWKRWVLLKYFTAFHSSKMQNN